MTEKLACRAKPAQTAAAAPVALTRRICSTSAVRIERDSFIRGVAAAIVVPLACPSRGLMVAFEKKKKTLYGDELEKTKGFSLFGICVGSKTQEMFQGSHKTVAVGLDLIIIGVHLCSRRSGA